MHGESDTYSCNPILQAYNQLVGIRYLFTYTYPNVSHKQPHWYFDKQPHWYFDDRCSIGQDLFMYTYVVYTPGLGLCK